MTIFPFVFNFTAIERESTDFYTKRPSSASSSPKRTSMYVCCTVRAISNINLTTNSVLRNCDRRSFFDYRNSNWQRGRYPRMKDDHSIMSYSGHKVRQTLIRCNFSPLHSTGSLLFRCSLPRLFPHHCFIFCDRYRSFRAEI